VPEAIRSFLDAESNMQFGRKLADALWFVCAAARCIRGSSDFVPEHSACIGSTDVQEK